jgi:dynein assembly factor 5
MWMLELRDRYSYWHMMLPLLLTGYTDEIEEIRETTDSLWWDVGKILNLIQQKRSSTFSI